MLNQGLVESLVKLLGPQSVSVEDDDLERYSADALTPFRAFRAAPYLYNRADLVIRPSSVEQIVEVVKLVRARKTPIVPYGGGTGVMGGAIPVRSGIVMDLKKLNRVLEINSQDRTVLVEAGAVLEEVVQALEEHGLMLGHDPWSVPIATVGGTISTNGVGYRAAACGPMGEQVLGLEVVLPTGEVLNTRAVPKYSSGPNLNHLFIGSEGVFGIITKATLRAFPLPEKRAFATVGFDSFKDGFKAVVELFAKNMRPTLVDLTEEDGEVSLHMVYEGFKEGVEANKQRSLQICRGFGGRDLGEEDTRRYWNTRYQIAEGYRREVLNQPRSIRWQRRGRGFDYLHVALPVSKVLEYRRLSEEILSRHGVSVREYAVWGQPEFFSMLLVPSGEKYDKSRDDLADAVDEVLTLAQDMGGIMEYCHGVGIKLAHLMARELGVGLDVIRAMKQALDPDNIMNPGKLGL